MAIEISGFGAAEEFKLTHAVLVYRGRDGCPSYVSVHHVHTNEGSTPVIQAGVPASKAGLLALMQVLAPEKMLKAAFKPPHVLADGNGYFVWFSKPQVRQVWFKCPELGGERTARVPCPGLVFIVAASHWYVFAYKGKTRPNQNTPLFVAPFFNVYAAGNVCVGNVSLPSGDDALNSSAWETAFFNSYFTHPNIHQANRLTRYKDGPFALWRDLLEGSLKSFPTASLVATKKTVWQAFEAAMEMEVRA